MAIPTNTVTTQYERIRIRVLPHFRGFRLLNIAPPLDEGAEIQTVPLPGLAMLKADGSVRIFPSPKSVLKTPLIGIEADITTYHLTVGVSH